MKYWAMLKSGMKKVISNSQNAFVRDRHMLDSIFITNESLNNGIRAGESGLLCKLYPENTFEMILCCAS